MIEVLERKSLRLVSHCHLRPLTVPLPQPVPVDPVLFPAAVEGFAGYNVVTEVHYFGDFGVALLDISGFTRIDIKHGLLAEYRSGRSTVPPALFLQCLDWVHTRNYPDKFTFERIAGYHGGEEVAVAEPVSGGFKRVPYPGDDVPWPEGTLGLFSLPSL